MTSYSASGTVVATSAAAGSVVHTGTAKAAVQYADFNIGVETVVPINRVVQYMEFNIGLEPLDLRDTEQYTDFNVGLQPAPRIGSEYADFNVYASTGQFHRGVYTDFNVDPTAPPVPHIWYIKPDYGKEGLLFNVIGMGFGTSQAEYDGHVQLGVLDCPVNKWEDVPAQTSQALRVGAYPNQVDFINWDDENGNGWPVFTPRLKASRIDQTTDVLTLHMGDIIEFYYVNRTSTALLPDEVHPVPWFQKLTWVSGFGASYVLDKPFGTFPSMDLLVDQNGVSWSTPVESPVGTLVYRKFIVPSQFDGKTTANWGAAFYGQGTIGRPARVADFSRFVVRQPDGTPRLWVTQDDGSTPAYGYYNARVFGSQDQSTYFSDWTITAFLNAPWMPAFIDYGATDVEHEWVVVVVPDGAESGMVKIVLEDT